MEELQKDLDEWNTITMTGLTKEKCAVDELH
jgi:hypothetical protein